MARSGRVKVYIDAESSDLVRETKTADRALDALGRSGVAAGTRASAGLTKASLAARAFSKAGTVAAATTTRIGNAAKTATPYIVGGLALGLAKSVSEFREAEKAGAQTAAVIKSTGGAAKVTAAEVENLAAKISLKTGIDDEAIQSGENLLLTFKNIRNETGAGNAVFDRATKAVTDMSVALGQDMKAGSIQLGKALNDPIAGLTSLTRVGVTFDEQTKERIALLVESGKRLKAQKIILGELESEFGGSAKAQADSFDKLKVAGENFAESVGKKVTPVLSEMADELSEIFSGKLSGEERMDALGSFLEKWVGKGIGALEAAAPQIAETAGKIGLRAAGAFGRAFLDMGLGGKAVVGGYLLAKFGGAKAFSALGRTIGSKVGAGLVVGLALAGPELITQAFKLGKKIGEVLEDTIPSISDILANKTTAFSDPKLLIKAGDLKTATKAYRDMGLTAAQAREKVHDVWLDIISSQGKGARSAKDTADKTDQGYDNIKRSADSLADALGSHSKRGADAVDKNLDRAKTRGTASADRLKDGVAGSVGSLAAAVASGMRNIGKNLSSGLKSVGAKPINFAIEDLGAAVGQGIKMARGGLLPGYSPVDNVPAMLRSGEAVLTPEVHQPIVNQAMYATYGMGLDDLFRSTGAQMFKGGGIADRTGVKHYAGGGIVGLGNQLQSQGYLVGEHPAFGGVAPVHTSGSYHYSGQALDVNWVPTSQEPGKLTALYNKLKGAPGVIELLWQVANHFDHLHVAMGQGAGAVSLGATGGKPIKLRRPQISGPDGALKSVGQGAIGKVHAAAQKLLTRRQLRTTSHPAVSGITSGGGSPAKNMALGKRMLASPAQWPALQELWTRESGWNHLAENPSSGAYGIPQSLPASKMASAGSDWRTNPATQIRWGLGYIGERYGSPSSALSFHNANNWYRKGGFAGRRGFGKGKAGRGRKKPIRIGSPVSITLPVIGGATTGVTVGVGDAKLDMPAYSYEEQLSLNDISMIGAEGTGGTADDVGVLQDRGGIVAKRLAKLRRQLKKTTNPKRRAELLAEIASLMGDQASIGSQIADIQQSERDFYEAIAQGFAEEAAAAAEAAQQSLIEAQNAAAEEMRLLRESIDQQNRLVQAVGSSDGFQALRAFADLMSGELGGRIAGMGHNASFGSVARA